MPLSVFKSEERQHSPSVFQVAAAAGKQRVIDFCYLSNKFFPTADMIARLAEDIEDIVRNYPSMQTEQCELAAALTGFRSDEILVGNGASELIHLVTARLGQRWLMPFPSYMEYENVLRDFGKRVHLLQLEEKNNFAVDPERVLQEMEKQEIDALVIPNPNSPTGQKVSRDGLLSILERGRRLKTVVVDESFIEFTASERSHIPTLRGDLEKYPQLIIMRSLGKDYGACGLRLGLMASSNRAVLDEIRKFLPIWNISPMAEKFLRLCVEYRADYEKARLICIQETQLLVSRLSAVSKLKVFDTFSNFVLFKILDERVTSVELRDQLLNQFGFYVRDCSRKAGLGDKFIRVGTNLPNENTRLVKAISDYL
jgi:threonine-phosphate decarboxylase